MENNPQKPFLMPGPQFGEKPENSWWHKNSQKIILGLIAILLIVGAVSFYKNYQNRKMMLESAINNPIPTIPLENIIPSATPASKNSSISQNQTFSPPTSPSPKPKVIVKENGILGGPAKTISSIPEIKIENRNLVAKAASGNGKTHLARYALKEYLKDKTLENELKAEQKIYIEDYLQKHVKTSGTLKVGDEITFSEDLIKEAITQAQELTPNQLKNLQKYVPLVPSI